MRHLIVDAVMDYDEDEEEEIRTAKESYDHSMDMLWTMLDKAKPLPTTKVQAVETESRQLKNMLEKKERSIQQIEEQRFVHCNISFKQALLSRMSLVQQ